jgi:hypothetical protein
MICFRKCSCFKHHKKLCSKRRFQSICSLYLCPVCWYKGSSCSFHGNHAFALANKCKCQRNTSVRSCTSKGATETFSNEQEFKWYIAWRRTRNLPRRSSISKMSCGFTVHAWMQFHLHVLCTEVYGTLTAATQWYTDVLRRSSFRFVY